MAHTVQSSRSLPLEYSEETARSIEVNREDSTSGRLGTFGFILHYEKPPIVGTIVPGECMG